MQILQLCSKPSNLTERLQNSLSGFSILQRLHFFIFVFGIYETRSVFFRVEVFLGFYFFDGFGGNGGRGWVFWIAWARGMGRGVIGFLVEKEKNSTPGGFG
jgi:hypothetical protein